jgi:rhamnosyltransferase
MTEPAVSVIVRARDEATSIGRCLELLRGQRIDGRPPELIVVDSGSRDATAEIARRHGAKVIELPASAFSFGGALNLGCANARGEILVALSAHAFPRDELWLGRLAAEFGDRLIACACGDAYGPDGSPLTAPVRQDLALATRRPEWGFSNAAGAVRADLWRRRPFRADLPGGEDKEWAWHWLAQGYACVVDPALTVEHDHTHDPVAAIYARARREWEGFATFLVAEQAYALSDLAAQWWSDQRFYDSPARARLSHRRAARLLGGYAGRRRARRGHRSLRAPWTLL